MAGSRLSDVLDPPARPTPGPVAGEEGDPRARILIVDDDERNAFAASQALEGMDCELVMVRSGEEALKRLLADEFAVILLDLHMPGMDGYETAALIRGRRRSRDIPIVFLTAVFRDEAHLFQAYTAGAVDVVFKPVDPFILRSKVSVLVDLHLKTEEIRRQAEHTQRLLDENRRVLKEKRLAERALRRSQARQESILKSLPIVLVSRSIAPPFAPSFISDSVRGLTGFEPERFLHEPEFGLSRVHPDDRDQVVQALGGAVRTGAYACEFRWRCADGDYRWFLDQGLIAAGEDGETAEIFSTLLDFTDRRMLEQQLTQARKMEAVGRLTGGVAHDFNNLLTVILGNIDFLSRRGPSNPNAARQLTAMRHAAERGRGLTRQLLAFGRRQHLHPKTLDVNVLIRESSLLVRQAVGESVTIANELSEERLTAHIDPAQLETAVLNLALNARDAMSDGGRLTIRTSRGGGPADLPANEAAPGGYVLIEVADDGCGMPPNVLDRIFEPFYTTKEVGRGTGLGLSQVYGFVSQSGGHVRVTSRPGEGSSFRLYLPASDAPADADTPEQAPLGHLRGSERLLVVEDDLSVLAMTQEILETLGYEVATALDAPSALAVLERGDRVDLILSDVVMPGGVTGDELARRARALRPDLPILLTSGYFGEAARIREEEFSLIDKPFGPIELAGKLRELLDARPPPKRRRAGKPKPPAEA
jgi:signal transduction histidine kinase/DNA-binding response OmpR family regulator